MNRQRDYVDVTTFDFVDPQTQKRRLEEEDVIQEENIFIYIEESAIGDQHEKDELWAAELDQRLADANYY